MKRMRACSFAPMRTTRAVALFGSILFATPASAAENTSWVTALWQDTTWDVSTGFDYSTGRYGGTSDTTTLSVPLNLRVQLDRVRLEASVPYVDVRGPGVFAGGVIVGGSSAMTTRSGLGDVNAGAAWLLHADSTLPAFEIAGNVKVPTASAGLGTGKFDYAALANVSHSISPEFMVFGSVGYQWLSNFGTTTLEDGVTASAGVNFKPSPDFSIGVAGNYRQEYFQGLGEQVSVSPYVLWNLSQNWRVTGYGTLGLTDASPRAGGGLRIIFAQ